MTPLSAYLLTFNSQRRLEGVLASLQGLVDDLVIVDSGSTDRTAEIAARFGARFIHRAFDNFTMQRVFAVEQCRHRWILVLDSDEEVSEALRQRILRLEADDFQLEGASPDAFGIRRDWFFLNRKVHCFYPSLCPDQPIRLFCKDVASYIAGRHVHESMSGFKQSASIEEPLLHYTSDSVDEVYAKLNQYSTLAARDLQAKGATSSWLKIALLPWAISLKWYLLHGGWRDGVVGLIHGRYVRDMVYQKYLKLKFDLQPR